MFTEKNVAERINHNDENVTLKGIYSMWKIGHGYNVMRAVHSTQLAKGL